MKKNEHADKIKAELVRKIQDHDIIENKIGNIERQTKTELLDQLSDTGGEYSELLAKKLDLESEITELLIETVYVPLFGLTNLEKKRIDFSIISHSLDYNAILEKYFGMELLNFIDHMKRRFKKLKGLHLTREVERRIVMLYKEIARCYVYCLFAASTALCRALTESVAEEYCMQSEEFRIKIKTARKFEKRKVIYDFLRSKFPQEMLDIYSEIGTTGSSVLHPRFESTVDEKEKLKLEKTYSEMSDCDEPDEEDALRPDEEAALRTIELSHKFVNWIYKTPDFSTEAKEV